jgi:hypothetical protein
MCKRGVTKKQEGRQGIMVLQKKSVPLKAVVSSFCLINV